MEGGPKIIHSIFDCSNNNLSTLKGCPFVDAYDDILEKRGSILVMNNPLISIEDYNSPDTVFKFSDGNSDSWVYWEESYFLHAFYIAPYLFAYKIKDPNVIIQKYRKDLIGLSKIYDKLQVKVRNKVLNELNIAAEELSGIRNVDKFGLF